jgi:NitT/TauT family transport system substrate-binding protein
VFSVAMMSEQIHLFKPFFYTEATKGLPIGMQSETDWADTLKSMADAKAIPSGSKPSDYFTNDCIDRTIVDKVASATF